MTVVGKATHMTNLHLQFFQSSSQHQLSHWHLHFARLLVDRFLDHWFWRFCLPSSNLLSQFFGCELPDLFQPRPGRVYIELFFLFFIHAWATHEYFLLYKLIYIYIYIIYIYINSLNQYKIYAAWINLKYWVVEDSHPAHIFSELGLGMSWWVPHMGLEAQTMSQRCGLVSRTLLRRLPYYWANKGAQWHHHNESYSLRCTCNLVQSCWFE